MEPMGASVNTDGRMDVEQARSALQQVRAHEDQALRAAYPRLPWWNLAGKALVFTAFGAMGQLSPDGIVLGFPVGMILGVAVLIGLQELTERRIGIKIRLPRHSARSAILNIAETLVVLTVLVLTVLGFHAIDAPLPNALAGLATGLTAAALAQPVQRARYAALRR